MTDGGEESGAAAAPSFKQRVVGALRLLVPLLLVPLLLGLLLGGRNAAMGATLGAFGSFMIAAGGGWRTASAIMPIALGASAVAGLVYDSAGWAALVTLAGVACGLARAWGLLPQFALAGILVVVAPPLESGAAAAQYLLFAALGTVSGILLARRAGMPEHARGEPTAAGPTALFTVLFGITAWASAALALRWDSDHAYWLPLMVFLLAMPSAELSLTQRASGRMLGTLLGAAFTVLLIPLGLTAAGDIAVGFVLFVLAFVYAKPLWLNAALTAGAIVLLLTAGSADAGAGATLDRIAATAVGSALLLVAAVVATVLLRLVQPSEDEKAVAETFEAPGSGHPATAAAAGRD